MNNADDNPLLQAWDAPFGLPPFDRIARRAFRPCVRYAHLRAHARRDRGDRAASDAAPTFENTIAALDRSGRDAGAHRAAVPQPDGVRDVARAAGGRARDGAAPRRAPQRDLPRCRSCSSGSIGCIARRDALALDAESTAPARAHPSRFRARGRTPFRRRDATRMARDRRAPRAADHAVQPERAGRRVDVTVSCCATSAISPACRTSCATPRAKRRSERGQPDAWVITLSRSLIVPFLTFSDRRDLRERRVQRLDAPRRERRRARQSADRARDPRAAQRAGAAARLWQLRRLRAGRPDGRHAGRGRAAADAGLGAGEGQGARPSATRCTRWRCACGRTRSARAVGLALLRREGAQGALRLRRGDAEALLFARSNARGGVRLRASAVRHAIRAERPTSTPITPTCASTRSAIATSACSAIFLADNFARPTKRGGAWMSVYR